jgi:ATP-dependent RNA helicase RhlE
MKEFVLTSSDTQFSDLGLIEPLLRALTADGYTTPTPIQRKAIPFLLDGRDIIGCAQTGTGKTAAFALPLLQHLFSKPTPLTPKGARILVLSPTRELASQIHAAFGAYGRFLNLRRTSVFGGVKQAGQVKAMARGVDVLVATPGRLRDLMNQGHIDLSNVEAFVLDEADRMLDMGFIHDIRKIAATLPASRQTLLFSATMAPAVAKLAQSVQRDAVRVDVAPQATTAATVKQEIIFVERAEKTATLLNMLETNVYKAIVFTRTKHGANRLDAQLHKNGVKAMAIHGNKSQNARKRALSAFQDGHVQVLVATDVAARGLDIDDVTHVFNYDMPTEPEAYVHRIGRTGRAGAEGIAISLCDGSERGLLRRLTGDAVTEFPTDGERPAHRQSRGKPHGKPNGQRPNGRSGENTPKRRRKRKQTSGNAPQQRAAA